MQYKILFLIKKNGKYYFKKYKDNIIWSNFTDAKTFSKKENANNIIREYDIEDCNIVDYKIDEF